MLDLFVVPLAAALCVGSATSPIADVFVDASAANCATGSGSAADPVCSITAAIAIASPGDTVRIAPGTYVENVVIGIDLELVGTGGADMTIVDGGGIISATLNVVQIPIAVTVTIDGLTLRNGYASRGGGVLAEGDLTLKNSTVTANRGFGSGGGIYSSGILTVMNSMISENYSGMGGGIASSGAGTVLTISNSTIRDNVAQTDSYYGPFPCGGGVWQAGGTLSIRSSTISGNRCRDMAFGYNPFCGYPAAYARGGGIHVEFASLVMTSSTVSGNLAIAAPAVFGFTQGGSFGAGVSSRESFIQISNSTITGNHSYEGAGCDLDTSLVGSRLSNVTITANRAADPVWWNPGATGGVRLTNGSLQIHNTLIAGNEGTGGPPDVFGSITSLGHNLVGTGAVGIVSGVNGDTAGTVVNPVPAFLGPLEDNGGLTQTHALRLGSPALDAGDPLVFEPFDQRGVARPAFGLPDIGAYEADDSVQAPDLCSGTGGGFNPMCADCPCNNKAPLGTVGGCLNSAGRSARIIATGDTSVSLPPISSTDLRIAMVGATSNSFSVMFSGDMVAPALTVNPCFGLRAGAQSLAFDGLRCAIMNTRRHGGRMTDSNGEVGFTNSAWGGDNAPHAGLGVEAGFVAGQTRYFQAVYREDLALGCMRGLNTSQAVRIEFTP